MKAVAIAAFTVFMGFSAYVFGNLTTKELDSRQETVSWVVFGVLIAASILSILWAAKLGLKEDQQATQKFKKEMESLDEQIMYYGSRNTTPPLHHDLPVGSSQISRKYKWYQRLILWFYKKEHLP